ncbi:hypothetical protein niasHS_000511 [Heterodera schachtii]|uniref:R3H domain-containing protein n=1 Tax=Heterodera schachtii TaxID=97005 RepID=A0ABD2K4F9_HETSC
MSRRKLFSRSDAVIAADEDKKSEMPRSRETHEFRRSSVASISKDSFCADSTGIDILRFIEDTLHKNSKDRDFLLDTERKLRELLVDERQSFLVFPSLSSYNRMLVHRIAAFFGLLHNVDQSGQKVVVTKLPGTKLPDIEFEQLIKHNDFYDFHPARRNGQSFDESKGYRFPMREFRNRFNTTASEGANGGELSRNRRARSFEIDSDWYTGFPRQHLAFHRYSATFDNAGGADMASGNCSSSASSTAISAQMHPLHLPMLQPPYANSSTEASLISPSSAYSEPAACVRHQTAQFANSQCQIPCKNVTDSPPPAADVPAPSTKDSLEHPPVPASSAVRPPSLFAVQPNPSQFFAHPSSGPMVGFRSQAVPPFVFSHPALLSPAAIGPNFCYPSGMEFAPPPLFYYPTSSGMAFYPATTSYQTHPSFARSFPPLKENGHNLLADQFGRIGLTQNNAQTEQLPVTERSSQMATEGAMAAKGQPRRNGTMAISQEKVQ